MNNGIDLLTVVLAEKACHVGSIHGMTQRGGTLPITELFAIRFIPVRDKFVIVQLVSNGVKSGFKYGMLRKTTIPVKKEVKKKVEVVDSGSTGLFD